MVGGAPTPDGRLQVADRDTITVAVLDEDDGAGGAGYRYATASADCLGPEIRSLRIEGVTDQRMTVKFQTDVYADTRVEWGETAALGQIEEDPTPRVSHEVMINRMDLCRPYHLRVSSADAEGNRAYADLAGAPFEVRTWGIPGLYWRETFENGATDWTLGGEWEAGPPQGLGGASGLPDPPEAYNNDGALGTDLSGQGRFPGDYEPLVMDDALTPDLDASGWTDTHLVMRRHLNVGLEDEASIAILAGQVTEVFNDGMGEVADDSFRRISYDVSAAADGESSVQVRFRLQSGPEHTGGSQYSGWNIDDVYLKDGTLPDFAACGGCATAPAFRGATSAEDNDACAASGATVSWDRAVSWGTGGSGTYAVYRDDAPGFVPGAGNLVAAGLSGLSYDDPTVPPDRESYYLVRAENDETCGGGPNNAGLTDTNVAYVAVTESTAQPVPGDHDTLRAGLVNHAHLRLAWDAVPGAATYRVYRSTSPQRESFVQLDETAAMSWEDLDQGASPGTFYYLVRGINACGEEAPPSGTP